MSAVLRAPTEADLAEVVRLMSKDWPEPIDAAQVRRRWSAPGFSVECDARLDDGAYVLVEDLGNGCAWIDVRGLPSPALLDWAEARAHELSPRVLSGGWSSNELLLRELEQRGYGLIRHSQWMEIDLDGPIPAPRSPEGIEVRTYRAGDETEFHAVQQETFEDTWDPVALSLEEWTRQYVESPRFVPDLWFLAVAGNVAAGVAICHPHPGGAELGWIGELGVRRPWRRRGVGRALLLHAFSKLRARGFPRAGLSVDSDSPTGANRLYEQVGMTARARFDIYEKAAS